MVAWDEVASEDATGESFPTVARLFPDGSEDWIRRIGLSEGDAGFTGDPVYVRDLQVDGAGNVILLTNSWLQAFAPDGRPYPGMPEPLSEAGGLFTRPVSNGWLVVGASYGVFSLPDGELVSYTQGQGLTAWPEERSGFWLLDDQKYLLPIQSKGLVGAPPDQGYERGVVEVTVPPPDQDGYSRTEIRSLLSEQSELRTSGGRITVAGKRTIYAFAEVEPETHLCEKAVLLDIDDNGWAPNLEFCGTPMSLLGASEARVLSLWAASDEDAEPATAVPLLTLLDPDGERLRVWDLREELGLVEFPVFGLPVNLAMTLSEDGKKVLVAGTSVETLEVRLALLELDPE